MTPLQSSALAVGRTRPKRPKAFTQAVAMQETLFSCVQDSSIPAHIRAACARAWSDLEERKRILRGKPLPGHLRPELAKPSKPARLLALPTNARPIVAK